MIPVVWATWNGGRGRCVYVLRDPRDGAVRYIGKTSRGLEARRAAHVQDARRRSATPNHRLHWLRELAGAGLRPEIVALRWCWTDEEASAIECDAIAWFRICGARLTNGTIGGDGVVGWSPSPDHRRAVAEANRRRRGRKATAEHRAKIAAALRGRRHPPERVARMAAARWGRGS